MRELLNKRVLLVTGKGGVGRSSLTAALARVAAESGKKVLITEVDTDGDYSALARAFGHEHFDETLTQVAPGIRATAMVPRRGHELFMTSILRNETVAKKIVGADSLKKFGEAAPSLRELGIFFHFLTLMKATTPSGEREHDLILVDMPATGHALALTGLPEIILNLVRGGPVAQAIREGQEILNHSENSATLVVTLPEELPVTEALELIDGLKKTRMPIGGVLLNRMPIDPFTASERQTLTPLLKSERHLGAGDFHRHDECLRARDRLSRGLRDDVNGDGGIPLITLSESPDHDDLIQGLVQNLRESLASSQKAGGA